MTKFNFHKANLPLLKLELEKIQWDDLKYLDDPNNILDQIYTRLNNVFKDHIPLTSIPKIHKFPLWWSHTTKRNFNRKERLRKTKNKNIEQSNKYSELRRTVKKQIKTDYKTFIQNSVKQLKTDSKYFWKFIKQKKEPGKLKQYKYKDKIISSPKEISQAFAEHLQTSFAPDSCTYNIFNLPPSISSDFFSLPKVRESDILFQINQIEYKKPAGPDGILPGFIKKIPNGFVRPLMILFNRSLDKSVFPSKLKEAVVTPIPKKSSDKIEDQRPISNINAFAKIFEGIIYDTLSVFIFNHVSIHQHGFIKARSTVTNLVEFSHFIAENIERKQIDVLYTDVEKAFDRLNHDAILRKMNTLGFSRPSLSFFTSYLRDRKLKIGEVTITPNSGVAQGSKISSLLFIMTYDDIRNHIKYSHYSLYADDFKIYKAINSPEDCYLLQRDIDAVSDWLTTIGLNFHPLKCKQISYSTKEKRIASTYTINSQPVEATKSFKDLGVLYQSNFSFIPHIEQIATTAYRNLGMIIRYCKQIDDIDAIRVLYLSLVRSKVEYASLIWSPSQKKSFKNNRKYTS